MAKSPQSLESVATERYIKRGETLMIDIRKELRERLQALDTEKRGSSPESGKGDDAGSAPEN